MYENLTEHVIKFATDIDDFADPKVGQGGTYVSELRDPSGAVVGTADGAYYLVARRPSDNEIMTLTAETLSFDGDEVRVESWSPFTKLVTVTGEWQYHPATGVTGRFAGRTGVRMWRPVDLGKVAEAKLIFFHTMLS